MGPIKQRSPQAVFWPTLFAAGLVVVAGTVRGQQPQTGQAVRTWFEPPADDEGEPLLESGVYDPSVQSAAMVQPALSTQPSAPSQPPVRRATRGAQQANVRLASVPNMFGDLQMITAVANVLVQNPNGQPNFFRNTFGLPTAGSIRTGKI